jgi:hypothetical protein|tara:strand:+ start:771 stop:1607 length:837 start_codon:yes stop_codon:yes gene_type:complete
MIIKNSLLLRILRFFSVLKKDGFSWTIVRIFLVILKQPNEIQRAKNKVLNKIILEHGHQVAYGTFKGMKLSKNTYWSKNDIITHILGVYEKHVLKKIIEFSKKGNYPFIDIGAADGYFAIGMAFSETFKKIYAFEIDEEGRRSLNRNIENNLCKDKVVVDIEANFETLKEIVDKNKSAVILIDIEGSEFDLLDDNLLQLLSNCYIVCELHPTLSANGFEKQNMLINNAKAFFDVSIIQRESYSPNKFSELNEFTDEERLIAFGEGRENNMNWLILEPK